MSGWRRSARYPTNGTTMAVRPRPARTCPIAKVPRATSAASAAAGTATTSPARRTTRRSSGREIGLDGAAPASPNDERPAANWATPSVIPTPAARNPACQLTVSPSRPVTSGASSALTCTLM
ncbi:hypothetical protein BJF79_44690 [Actinomadura sp. CNU-125]|nr:hypothetical protein BJF79_44690 [Actinomadura sp. CNU-125]